LGVIVTNKGIKAASVWHAGYRSFTDSVEPVAYAWKADSFEESELMKREAFERDAELMSKL